MEHPEWKNSIPIDLVVPYVDSSDLAWKADFRKMLSKQIGGNSSKRYRPMGLFKYFFRGVFQNMPWIRTVHLVVARESQVPKWLDRSNPKLHIVYHKDYIPASELPTFNSNVIEMFYHKIPGLSENFIIANDDFFVLRPASEYEFFRGDLPVDTNAAQTEPYRKKGCIYNFRTTLWNNNNLLAKLFKKPAVPSFKVYHKFTPIKKSTFEEVWSRAEGIINKGILASAFRLSRNYTWHMIRAYGLIQGKFVNDPNCVSAYKYIELTNITKARTICLNYKYTCLNDMIVVNSESVAKIISEKLTKVLPHKSGFEYGYNPATKQENITSSDILTMTEEDIQKKFPVPSNPEIIISFTSFGKRLNFAASMVLSVLKVARNAKIVMTLYKDDVPLIPSDLKKLISSGVLSLLVSDVDYGPHLKYIRAMEEYYDKAIMTLDDDRIYSKDYIDPLITQYKRKQFKTVITNCAIKMQKGIGRTLREIKTWQKNRAKPNETSIIAMAEGFSGVIYPPRCFKDLPALKNEILICKYDDDLFLKMKEIEEGIPVTTTDFENLVESSNQIAEMLPWNLHKTVNSAANNNRNKMIKKLESRLIKGFNV